MITFLTTGAHKYGAFEIEDMEAAPRIDFRSYNWLYRQKRVPRSTYIFTDFDRLSAWQTELAARIFHHLAKQGVTVLNDPARALQRLPLLRQLYRQRLNQFDVWDAAVDELPDRYPVFLRTRSAHRGALGELIQTREDAKNALADALGAGFGIHDLMFVEYCAEPTADGVFRKLAAFRVGDTVQMAFSVHERNWHAKYGEEGVASQALYDEEYAMVETNPFGAELRKAFEVARIEYGRLDFAIVDGKTQTYEINTNPHVSTIPDHPFPIRMRTQALFIERLVQGLQKIDSADDGSESIALDIPELKAQQKIDWLVLRERWTI